MANLVPNPCAATDLTGWTTLSDATLARVTSVPGTTIPSPATTALRVDPDKAIECDVVSLGVLTEGDWLAWAVDLSPGAAEDGGTWEVDIYWYDGASYYAGDPTIVLEDAAVEDGWTHYEGTVQIPADCDGFGVYVTTFDQTTTYVYATLFSVAALVTVDQAIDWPVLGLLTVDLAADWAVQCLLAVRDRGFDWAVQVCLPVRDRGFDWAVAGQLIRDLETDWTVVDENPVTVDLATDWSVGTLVTVSRAFDWRVLNHLVDEHGNPVEADDVDEDGNPIDEEGNPIEGGGVMVLARTTVELNGVDLNDGVNLALMPGAKLPRRESEYTMLRNRDAYRQADLRDPPSTASIPMKATGVDAAGLEAQIDAVFTEVTAGGTLSWQAPGGALQTFIVGASPEPEVVYDILHRSHYIALFTLQLVALP